jgi:hypothetical protein
MRKIFLRSELPLIVVLLSSCVSAVGPTFERFSVNLPPPSAGQGRIGCYRNPRLVAAAVQHEVKLNDEIVGSSIPDGFFCIDRPTGKYELSIYHWAKRSIKFTLEAGQTRYVRFPCVMDVPLVVAHCYPEIVDEAVAKPEIAKTRQNQKCVICPQNP